MRAKLIEISATNNMLDSGKKSKIFRQVMYRFGPEVHKFLIQTSPEYRQICWIYANEVNLFINI